MKKIKELEKLTKKYYGYVADLEPMFRHPDLFFILFFSTLITQIYTELRRFLIYFFICATYSSRF